MTSETIDGRPVWVPIRVVEPTPETDAVADSNLEFDEELAAVTTLARRLERERNAYKKAKQENDERFMLERDQARAEAARLEKETARQDRLITDNFKAIRDMAARNEDKTEMLRQVWNLLSAAIVGMETSDSRWKESAEWLSKNRMYQNVVPCRPNDHLAAVRPQP
jgi:hypothetical protein